MKHEAQKLAIAGALTMGTWYSLKTALLVFARDLALKLYASGHHMVKIDTYAQNIEVTLMGYLTGLVAVVASSYAVILLGYYIYQYLCCQSDTSCGWHNNKGPLSSNK